MADPTWLPDVLRAAGLTCNIYPGAFDRGHGDFGNIWGVICHHTGSFGETPQGIAQHPSLGLASQLYLSRDGVYTLCGVGQAWHAGRGSWQGLPANDANSYTIGIEAANDGGGTPGKPHRASWSDAQYNSYVTGVAAILNKLGQPASHAIGHKEWAGPAQGKWDPGAIDMNIFRADVARKMEQLKGAPAPAPVNLINQAADIAKNWIGARLDKDEVPVVGGRAVRYENATIYWRTGDKQAHPVPKGGLLEAYQKLNGTGGPLGLPVLNHTVVPDGGIQAFAGGILYKKNDAADGYYVTGAIANRFSKAGWEAGAWGWPTSNEMKQDDGTIAQTFEHVTAHFSPDSVFIAALANK